jgi:hypothetical protein
MKFLNFFLFLWVIFVLLDAARLLNYIMYFLLLKGRIWPAEKIPISGSLAETGRETKQGGALAWEPAVVLVASFLRQQNP